MKDKWSWKIRGAGVRWKKGMRATENERCETALSSHLHFVFCTSQRREIISQETPHHKHTH